MRKLFTEVEDSQNMLISALRHSIKSLYRKTAKPFRFIRFAGVSRRK